MNDRQNDAIMMAQRAACAEFVMSCRIVSIVGVQRSIDTTEAGYTVVERWTVTVRQ